MKSRFRLKFQFKWTFNEHLKKLWKNCFLNEIVVRAKIPIQMDFKIPVEISFCENFKFK